MFNEQCKEFAEPYRYVVHCTLYTVRGTQLSTLMCILYTIVYINVYIVHYCLH